MNWVVILSIPQFIIHRIGGWMYPALRPKTEAENKKRLCRRFCCKKMLFRFYFFG